MLNTHNSNIQQFNNRNITNKQVALTVNNVTNSWRMDFECHAVDFYTRNLHEMLVYFDFLDIQCIWRLVSEKVETLPVNLGVSHETAYLGIFTLI